MAAGLKPTESDTALISPFEDPVPSLSTLKPEPTNSETNPFRARNLSTNGTAAAPVTSAFPSIGPNNPTIPPLVSPAPKSKNPFLDLSVEDNPSSSESKMSKSEVSKDIEAPQRKHPSSSNGHPRSQPYPPRKSEDPNALRPSLSQRRRDPNVKPSDRDKERDRHRERRDRPPNDAPRKPRQRSNSDSSLPNDKPSRRKDDGHIHKPRGRQDLKKDDKKGISHGKRRLHPVDKIDLLDVTGLYGPHGFFHHDGPFDACRPHRNKQPHKAPVAAFPADSLTNTLAGGIGEVPGLDRDKYFGLAPTEAFQDYGHIAPQRRTSDPEKLQSRTSKEDTYAGEKIRPSFGIRNMAFDPRMKTEPVHGVESAGLGTSTFLEGAPAPKSAIDRANAEEEENGALSRKKSLLQKVKSKRIAPGDRSPPAPPPLQGPLISPTATTPNLDSAYNPFAKENQFVERVETVPTSNRERADSGGSDKPVSGNLLTRVKSLKISGGRRSRKNED